MDTKRPDNPQFNNLYVKHGKLLKLTGYQPKTIEAYTRAIRRIGNYFDCQLDSLSKDQLLDYFHDLAESHSWNTVNLDLYGLHFFYIHVQEKTWENIPLVGKPKSTIIPATTVIDYRIFFFTAYSMALRISECISLKIGDIDADNMLVHIVISFQSTPPHGGRPFPLYLFTVTILFQSTPPHGGRRCH